MATILSNLNDSNLYFFPSLFLKIDLPPHLNLYIHIHNLCCTLPSAKNGQPLLLPNCSSWMTRFDAQLSEDPLKNGGDAKIADLLG
ncbi:hypothetical protein RchiOBHm_Chr5g0017151 [Rosa chinensis]|uniref:Uncharacterized protein n=1 Tax=Rosa chinensis TaxID=74649 RepID=A0A2P6Q6D7_ROSCH|nr:hypothetical protein RchiOBHm_Chr5g0017151 [Rosa chinensis]